MGKVTISLLILAAAAPAQANLVAPSDPAAPAAAQRGIDDPRAFVEQTYAA